MLKKFSSLYADKSKHEIEADLFQNIQDALHEKYGPHPDQAIAERVHQEWHAMEVNKNTLDVAVLHELCLWMRREGYAYWLNGCGGSSFILYLLGVTEGNPLPAHCLCPKCRSVKWNPLYKSGFDLPQSFAVCDADGSTMETDGQDIPWQALWGYGGKPASLDIRIDATLREPLYRFLENQWLCKLYPESSPVVPHPNHPSLFRFSHITFDALVGEPCAPQGFYKAKVDASCVPVALENWKSLLRAGEKEHFLENMDPPESFADLISLYGLFHSAGTWDSDCALMLYSLGYRPSSLIAFREDVYWYLLDHGFLEKDAWAGAQRVRLGKALPLMNKDMSNARDRWVLERLKTIRYLVSKAHAVEHIFFLLKTGHAFYSDDSI